MNFPNIIDLVFLRKSFDGAFDWLVEHYGEAMENATIPLLEFLFLVEDFFLLLPWFVIISIIGVLSYLVSKNKKFTFGIVLLMFLIGLFGVWKPAMESMALMLSSTVIAIIFGIPIGIIMSRSKKMEAAVLPILDIMQTMPIFVYLIPFVMFLGPGKVPALMATIVYAIPPLIRLTNLGIRHVDSEVVEAYTSFGANKRQILFNVQLPLALPTIMAGVNQTTMMALSMVVIASMIGAGGLGYQVLQGIQRLEVSRGLMAGLGIVFLAVVFDRIAQSYGRKMQQHLNIQS